MQLRRTLHFGLMLALFGASCRPHTREGDGTATKFDQNTPQIDHDAIDTSVHPCIDSYQFGCGRWLDHALIPLDQPSIGRADSPIVADDTALIHEIATRAMSDRAGTSGPLHKLGDFMATCTGAEQLSSIAALLT